MADASTLDGHTAERISSALAFADGHLFVDEGGYTLCDKCGGSLSGYDIEPVKAACIAAGLPVIDGRGLGIEVAVRLAHDDSPSTAPGDPPDALPWYGWAHGPLRTLAALYHAAGAEVANMPDVTGARTGAAA